MLFFTYLHQYTPEQFHGVLFCEHFQHVLGLWDFTSLDFAPYAKLFEY